jgi:hypothetical protein
MYPQLGLPNLLSVQRFTAPTPAGRILFKAVWGSTPTYITAAFVSTSLAVLVPSVNPWQPVTGGGYLLSGSARAVLLADLAADDNIAVRAVVSNIASNVLCAVRSTPDGRTCYEAGVIVSGGTTTYAIVRRRVEGSVVSDAVGPSAWIARVDVTARLGTSGSATIEARISAGRLKLFLNDEQTPTIDHDITGTTYAPPADTGTFAPSAGGTTPVYGKMTGQFWAGILSDVDQARVLEVKTAKLEGTTSARTDLLVAVAGGSVYLVQPDGIVRTVGSAVFDPAADVQLREFNGKVYMLGGGRARILDPIRLAVSNWTPTVGTLPGQTSGGTTTAKVLGQFGTRLALGGADNDPQNVWFSAVADALDYDTGSDLPGRAFTLAGTRPLKIGQPVTCLQEHTNSSLIVGCTGSMHLVAGDPVLGQFDTMTLLEDTGVSGTDAAVRVQDGRVLLHTPNGLVVVSGNQAVNITDVLLTTGIQTGTLVDAIVARDPSRHLSWIVLPDQTYAYDERRGQFTRGDGGLHPQTVPESMRTTAAAVWQGKLVLGCADGYLRTLDDAATTDDGTPIDSFITLLVMGDGLTSEVQMSNIKLNLTRKSGSTAMRVFGARTPEDAIDGKYRRTLLSMNATPFRNDPHPAKVRAPAVSLVVGPAAAGSTWSMESVTANVQNASTLTSPGGE